MQTTALTCKGIKISKVLFEIIVFEITNVLSAVIFNKNSIY